MSEDEFPIYRGLKLDEDDKVRRNVIKTLRTYFEFNFSEFNVKSGKTFQNYFKKECENLEPFVRDELIVINPVLLALIQYPWLGSSIAGVK